MRLPGAALLIVIGLFVLWLATTNQLDRLGKAYGYMKSGATDLPKDMKVGGDTASGILDPSRYHVAALMTTLDPVTADQPGGTF